MAGEIKNVTMKVEGSKLVIEIDLTKDFGLSASQKSFTVASTGGFVPVAGAKNADVRLNLNVIKPAKK